MGLSLMGMKAKQREKGVLETSFPRILNVHAIEEGSVKIKASASACWIFFRINVSFSSVLHPAYLRG